MIFTILDNLAFFVPWSRHLGNTSRKVWWDVRCASQRNHACLASTILSVVLERRGDLARFRLSFLSEVGFYDQQCWEWNRIALVRFYGELRPKLVVTWISVLCFRLRHLLISLCLLISVDFNRFLAISLISFGSKIFSYQKLMLIFALIESLLQRRLDNSIS